MKEFDGLYKLDKDGLRKIRERKARLTTLFVTVWMIGIAFGYAWSRIQG
jgi:hypothetical protein